MNERTAIRIIFTIFGVATGLWASRIAGFKAETGLSLSALSFLFILPPLGTFVGIAMAPKLLSLYHMKSVLIASGLFVMVSILCIGVFREVWLLLLPLFSMGVSIGFVEVTMNNEAALIDKRTGPIMSTCHGFWSIGTMIGAGVGSYFAELQIPIALNFAVVVPFLAVILVYATKQLLGVATIKEEETKARLFALPTLLLLPLALMPLGALLTEGAMMEWLAIFTREERSFAPLETGFGFAAFFGAMSLSRLFGDAIRARTGIKVMLLASSLLTFFGLILFASGSTHMLIICGAFCVGLGTGNIYPIAISLAGDLPTGKSEDNISQIAVVGFVAFLAGPPFMGLIGDAWSLSTAYLLLLPFVGFPIAYLVIQRRRAQALKT